MKALRESLITKDNIEHIKKQELKAFALIPLTLMDYKNLWNHIGGSCRIDTDIYGRKFFLVNKKTLSELAKSVRGTNFWNTIDVWSSYTKDLYEIHKMMVTQRDFEKKLLRLAEDKINEIK